MIPMSADDIRRHNEAVAAHGHRSYTFTPRFIPAPDAVITKALQKRWLTCTVCGHPFKLWPNATIKQGMSRCDDCLSPKRRAARQAKRLEAEA